jgi:hypothetical protein
MEAEVGELQQEIRRRGHGRGDGEEEPPTWEAIHNFSREATKFMCLSENKNIRVGSTTNERRQIEGRARQGCEEIVTQQGRAKKRLDQGRKKTGEGAEPNPSLRLIT